MIAPLLPRARTMFTRSGFGEPSGSVSARKAGGGRLRALGSVYRCSSIRQRPARRAAELHDRRGDHLLVIEQVPAMPGGKNQLACWHWFQNFCWSAGDGSVSPGWRSGSELRTYFVDRPDSGS